MSPNPAESPLIESPVIENHPRPESDDEDETIMPELKYDSKPFFYSITFCFSQHQNCTFLIQSNRIEISAESRAIIDRIERFIASVVEDVRNGNRIQIFVQNRQNWDNCLIENER